MAAKSIWGDTMQETLGPWTGKWLVNTHGDGTYHGGDGSGEISIVREDFKHGFRSYGWEGPAKFIVKQWDQRINEGDWDILIKAAHAFADQLNHQELFSEAR